MARNGDQRPSVVRLCRLVDFQTLPEDGILPHEPNYGTGFKPPSKKVIRTARQLKVQEHGTQMLLVDEIRSILKYGEKPIVGCGVLLGINCGLEQRHFRLRDLQSTANGSIFLVGRRLLSVGRGWPETREACRRRLKGVRHCESSIERAGVS